MCRSASPALVHHRLRCAGAQARHHIGTFYVAGSRSIPSNGIRPFLFLRLHFYYTVRFLNIFNNQYLLERNNIFLFFLVLSLAFKKNGAIVI
jgi:hypothetical protein